MTRIGRAASAPDPLARLRVTAEPRPSRGSGAGPHQPWPHRSHTVLRGSDTIFRLTPLFRSPFFAPGEQPHANTSIRNWIPLAALESDQAPGALLLLKQKLFGYGRTHDCYEKDDMGTSIAGKTLSAITMDEAKITQLLALTADKSIYLVRKPAAAPSTAKSVTVSVATYTPPLTSSDARRSNAESSNSRSRSMPPGTPIFFSAWDTFSTSSAPSRQAIRS